MQLNFIAPCIPAPVSCLDRAQTCHLRRRGRARSLPFSGFRPELCFSAGNAGLGQLCSLQSVARKEPLGGSYKGECKMQPSPSLLSGKTRPPWPRPCACCSRVAVQLGPGLHRSLDTCVQPALSAKEELSDPPQDLLGMKQKSGSVFVLCCCRTNYHSVSSLIQYPLIISVL